MEKECPQCGEDCYDENEESTCSPTNNKGGYENL